MKYVSEVFFLSEYHIKGGRALEGEVEISGAKNAALPILAASIVAGGESLLTSCPRISDVDSMTEILSSLGCRISMNDGTLSVDSSDMGSCSIPHHLMEKMRSSVFLAGSLLARCGEATISRPGGCNIGSRPIDIHIEGLKRLGAEVKAGEDTIKIKGSHLRGCDIPLPYPSVGATENIMMAALAAEGATRIINSAREPEIVDLQEYINKCGGKVSGAGTGVITVEGRRRLRGCRHRIMPDRIEAGTYMLMALGTGGRIFLKNIGLEHLKALVDIMTEAGFYIAEDKDGIMCISSGNEKIRRRISTGPYPGFPTDLQPQMTAFLTTRGKGSVMEENVFEKRTEYGNELKKMGADIEISEKQVIIRNNNILYGARVEAKDLRGGAALMIAGFMAEGETIISNTKYIKRGYSRPVEKIRGLGGQITENER